MKHFCVFTVLQKQFAVTAFFNQRAAVKQMLALGLVFSKQIFDLNAKRRGKVIKYEKIRTALPPLPFGDGLNGNKAFFRYVLLL
jgi:hypothetical protein